MYKIISIIIATICCICSNAQSVEIPARLTDRPELIIKHSGYTISYNSTHGTPNWSAWVLTKSHVTTGSISRTNVFLADPSIPVTYRIQPTDYSGSGFDRGHMAPAADMMWSVNAMHDSFYMSNMCPQSPTLNRIYWKQLEDACRKWTLTEDTLYIVTGPIYRSPYSKFKTSRQIDIPTGFFKVILSLRKGHAKTIGFFYKNASQKQSMYETVSTVDYIEHLTGIDFFYKLEDSLEEKLESKCNIHDWR